MTAPSGAPAGAPISALGAAVERILVDDGWPLTRGAASTCDVLETTFAGSTATWPCEIRVFAAQGQITFDSVVPTTVPDDRRAESCIHLVRANWEIVTGAFLLDIGSGQVRFRTSLLLLADAEPQTSVVLGMAYANVLTVDRCFDDLAALLLGSADAEEALERLGG